LNDGTTLLNSPSGISMVGDTTITGKLTVTDTTLLKKNLDVNGDIASLYGDVYATDIALLTHYHVGCTGKGPKPPPEPKSELESELELESHDHTCTCMSENE